MEQKVKKHLAETHAKTMFYLTYMATAVVCPVAVFVLTHLFMGSAWTAKHNGYIFGVGFGLAAALGEVIAKRVSQSAKK